VDGEEHQREGEDEAGQALGHVADPVEQRPELAGVADEDQCHGEGRDGGEDRG